MNSLKSKKVRISLGLLFASAIILCAVNPAPIQVLYKVIYVRYVRIAKTDFNKRFTDAKLEQAIEQTKAQAWVQKQIQDDLAPFKQGITHGDIERWFNTFQEPTHNKLAKFTVKANVVTVDVPKEFKQLRAFKTVYSVIQILASKQLIPDCEFIVALNDYLSYAPENAKPAAIFTFAKHSQIPIEKNTILVPDWMNVRYWDVLRGRIALANKLYPWARKKPQIHWRGGSTDSMHHRAQLMQLKKQFKFLDVAMTEGPNAAQYIDPEQSVQYKYQIALDGARCTWERIVWQMSANSVLIKPESPQIQWFHYGLEPYVNYIPIKNVDAVNISSIYEWMRANDDQVKQIVRNSNEFAKQNFKTENFFAYYAVVLQEYAKLYRD